MILTHPFLFYTIVVLFIAFTSGWVVFVITGRRATTFKNRLHALESEKQALQLYVQELEEQLHRKYTFPLNNTPVISLTVNKINKTN
ncbi:MAG: hypothetical protein ABIQ88_04790 [Chitinophagaceae bacterium]